MKRTYNKSKYRTPTIEEKIEQLKITIRDMNKEDFEPQLIEPYQKQLTQLTQSKKEHRPIFLKNCLKCREKTNHTSNKTFIKCLVCGIERKI